MSLIDGKPEVELDGIMNLEQNEADRQEREALSLIEPRQANLCLRAFRHDKFQLRMPSHSEGSEIWLSV